MQGTIRLNPSARWCSSLFFTNVESFIDVWSHPIVKDKNKLSILSIITRFWKLCSHTSLKKRLELKKKFILHYKNMHLHTSSKTIVFLTKHPIEVMEHPLTALTSSCKIPPLKSVLWGSRFDPNEAVVAVANSHFNYIDSTELAKIRVKWRQKWDKCTIAGGCYFENECIAE